MNEKKKELFCIDCGKVRKPGRRRCDECHKLYKRAYAKERFNRFGRYNYGKMKCAVCGKEITRNYKDQLVCIDCISFSTSETGLASNDYACGGKGDFPTLHGRLAFESLNRKLDKNEVVHHLNDDHTLNTLDNLIVVSRSVHTQIHSFLRKQKILLGYLSENRPEESWNNCARRITLDWLKKNDYEYILLSDIKNKKIF